MFKKLVVVALALPLVFSSCSNIDSSDGKPKKKGARAAVDMTEYKDVTSPDVNASLIRKADFALLSEGTYWNGDSSITLSWSKGRAVFYCPKVSGGEYDGKSFEADFVYDVKAASRDLLYICPLTKSNVSVTVGGQKVPAVKALPFCLFVPLYGFGQSRLEVSSIMDDEAVMPSGTYWKKK